MQESWSKTQYEDKISAANFSKLYSIVEVEITSIIEEYILPTETNTATSVLDDNILKAMTGFFIREEMVVSLVDLIQHRFFPGLAEPLLEKRLNIIAGEMASILNWTPARLKEEIEKFKRTI